MLLGQVKKAKKAKDEHEGDDGVPRLLGPAARPGKPLRTKREGQGRRRAGHSAWPTLPRPSSAQKDAWLCLRGWKTSLWVVALWHSFAS